MKIDNLSSSHSLSHNLPSHSNHFRFLTPPINISGLDEKREDDEMVDLIFVLFLSLSSF